MPRPRAHALDPLMDAAEFSTRQPVSGRFSLTVPRRGPLGSSEIPDDIAQELRRLDQTLAATIPTATK
ncbi:hypothetical protein [Nocardia fluminea]|uniref:hypothetical protein n=1 Tax=Nocardia fluminea TaxID=134984 RepID=UPI0033C04130